MSQLDTPLIPFRLETAAYSASLPGRVKIIIFYFAPLWLRIRSKYNAANKVSQRPGALLGRGAQSK